ncbi:hypothetical protein [Micromonospora cathayae]|uniref:Endoglucanase n=1 Tax=Micromonospora cathayae TaxID=3028804 RepID=A0ABY7ZLX3_9ACTN|nr:hypothetical protein [Micromonospora sp. HUAS 3]WDZ83441.1 hypothetical protein PVK37_23685 [Micromonospora sp. HUAS 3]
MGRIATAVKLAALAAGTAGLIALGATAAQADETPTPGGTGTPAAVVSPSPSPSTSTLDNNPWD